MKEIAVIGCGTMGNGIAHVFAQNGFKVQLIDINEVALKGALEKISKNLDRQVGKEVITAEQKENALQKISITTEMQSNIADCDLIIEAVSEKLEIKNSVFENLDKYAKPSAILASNTSSISITKIAAATKRADKVIGMHFMNPVPVMKLVEIIRGYNTSDETSTSIMDLSKAIGKSPVEVNDYPGFISNRILMPMINEAIYSLYEGVAGVQEIDDVMMMGMAHPMGPLQLADFIGLDVCLSILNVLYDGFGNQKYAPCPLLTNMVNAGKMGVKSGEGFYKWNGKEKIVSASFL